MVHLVADAAGLRAGAVLGASTLQVGAHVEETARYKNNSFFLNSFFIPEGVESCACGIRRRVSSQEDDSAQRAAVERSVQR